jgi:hypothetical protein
MKSTTNETDTQTLMGASLSSEYLYQEQERELQLADATDDQAWEGYSQFSADLEEAAWNGAEPFGEILIKKACEHSTCGHFRCSKSTRLGGIEI